MTIAATASVFCCFEVSSFLSFITFAEAAAPPFKFMNSIAQLCEKTMTSHARKQPKHFKNPYNFVKIGEAKYCAGERLVWIDIRRLIG